MESHEIFGMALLLILTVYVFLISTFTIGLVRILKSAHQGTKDKSDFVSVIIAVRNEERNIPELLEGLVCQDYPIACLEVIISDDYSDDETITLAGRFAASHPGFPIVIVSPSNADPVGPGKKRAIERAVSAAKGELLLFTDADTERSPGWITSMVSGFATQSVRMVMGPVCFSNERNLIQKLQSLEFMGLMGTTAGSAAIGHPVMCNGANMAYSREAFLSTGGFTGNLKFASGDDQFMMSAIRKTYGKEALAFNTDPVSLVKTTPESTFTGFMNQRLRWVSKSRGYRDPVVIFVGAVTYMAHIFLLGGLVAGIFIPAMLPLVVVAWFVKIILEYPMVLIMMRFLGKQKLAGLYFVAQLFHLFYVPVAGLLGLILPYQWKGRKL